MLKYSYKSNSVYNKTTQIFTVIFGVLFILMLLSYHVFAKGSSNKNINPHTINFTESKSCTGCHVTVPKKKLKHSGKHVIPQKKFFIKEDDQMCFSCHDNNENSHIVGVTPDYIVPSDLPINEKKQITCLTCHYVHGSLRSNKVVASTSFMDRLFNRERLNKSFLLRRNNANGGLCLACHDNE